MDKTTTAMNLAAEYEEEIMEPALKPEYIEKLKGIENQKVIEVGTVENFRKRYNL